MVTGQEELKITKVADASAAGVTTVNSTPVDMSGFEGVIFLTAAGTIAATAVAQVKVQQDTVVGMGTAADLAASGQSFTPTTDNLKSAMIDVKKPTKRFLRVVIARSVANSDFGQIYAIQYRAKRAPVTQAVDKSKLLVSPLEGVA